MAEVAQKLEITVQLVIGLRFHSSAMEDIVRVTLWLALLNEVRQSGAHAPICTAIECDEVVERRLSSFGSTQHMYVSDDLLFGWFSTFLP